MNIKQFAAIINGELTGDPEQEIAGVAGVREAGEGDITFISSPGYVRYLAGKKVACVIVRDFLPDVPAPQIRSGNPLFAFAKAIEYFHPKAQHTPGISERAHISSGVSIGKDVSIYPFVYIAEKAVIGDYTTIMPGAFVGAGATIGRDCLVYPNVIVREGVRIGNRVTIHAGTVIGSDGFGYVFENNEHYKIPQAGGIVIGDDVEIGSNVSVDRATTGNTVIGKGTKIDNLTQIAHNVTIGEKCLIVAQVGIAGSSEIGDFVVFGGQSAVADHSSIESGTMLAAQSGIKGNIKKGIYAGSPAIPHATWLRAQALFARLPELNKRIRGLEEKINRLEKGETS
jgi:UDP-3-O-[3-hydroxymyristoyl] glucosamine N-acyltransferase